MREPVPDTVIIPCLGCSKQVVVPAGRVRSAVRHERSYIVFCSRRCNMTYVAREGTRMQERLLREGVPDA